MNAQASPSFLPFVSAALLFASLVGGLIAASPTHAAMIACASGYHADARGNCQPDRGYVDSRCQDGFLATPSPDPNGYRCVPIPRGY